MIAVMDRVILQMWEVRSDPCRLGRRHSRQPVKRTASEGPKAAASSGKGNRHWGWSRAMDRREPCLEGRHTGHPGEAGWAGRSHRAS